MLNKIETQQRTNDDFPCGDLVECWLRFAEGTKTQQTHQKSYLFMELIHATDSRWIFPLLRDVVMHHAAWMLFIVKRTQCLICFLFHFVSFLRYNLVVSRGSNENRVINNAFKLSVNNASDVDILSILYCNVQDSRHSSNTYVRSKRGDAEMKWNLFLIQQFAGMQIINKWKMDVIYVCVRRSCIPTEQTECIIIKPLSFLHEVPRKPFCSEWQKKSLQINRIGRTVWIRANPIRCVIVSTFCLLFRMKSIELNLI